MGETSEVGRGCERRRDGRVRGGGWAGSLCRATRGSGRTVSLLFHHTHARRARSGGLCDSVADGATVLGGAMVVERAADGEWCTGSILVGGGGGSGGGSDRVP